MKSRIGMDVDEVVLEFVKSFLKFYTEEYGKIVEFDQIRSHNFSESLSLTQNEADTLVDKFCNSEEFENLDLVHGAKYSIFKLSERYHVDFITSRKKNLREKTIKNLDNYFSNIEYNLFFSRDNFGTGKLKSDICKSRGIKVIVEDNLEFSLSCADAGIDVLLLDQPWNQTNGYPKKITRVHNWDGILERLL